jgi:O-antigen ligase
MAIFIFTTGAYKRFINVFNFTDRNMLGRFDLWARAWDLFKISPVFGIGFARFNDVSPFTVADEVSGYKGLFALYTGENYVFSSAHAHNSYLNFLAETGLVGLALVLLFWAVCIRILWRGYRNSHDIASKTFLFSALGGIVTLLSLSLTEHYLSAPTVMMCISVTVSLSLGLAWQNKNT